MTNDGLLVCSQTSGDLILAFLAAMVAATQNLAGWQTIKDERQIE